MQSVVYASVDCVSVFVVLWQVLLIVVSADKLLGTHKGSPAVKQRKKNTHTEWVHKDNSTKQVSLLIARFSSFRFVKSDLEGRF